jgi:hypothetical protein
MDVSHVLDQAADDIVRYGWCRGGRGWHPTRHAPRCLEGGIYGATIDGDLVDAAMAALERYLGVRPYVWNDQPGRTADEVVHVLRVVAALEAETQVPALV